jgi:molybdate transport system substrate-binding protein
MRLITASAAILCLIGNCANCFPQVISPPEAIAQIGKPSVLVEMVVKKSKDRLEKRGIIFLDSEDDYTSEDNLGVAISADAAAKFKETGIPDPAAHFLNKTIHVRGSVMRFDDRPYLPVLEPGQITIVANAANSQSNQSDAQYASLVFSVAASTTDAANKLAERFKVESGIEVKVNPGPSNSLATQILAGAPADLFLSASKQWSEKVIDEGQATADVELLTNRLVIVVPKGNPAGIQSPDDLANASVKNIALAGEAVPAGQYAEQALTKLGLYKKLNEQHRIVRGQDVRAALAFVERGEAEAGIVYATDAKVAPKVEVAYEFDPSMHDEIVYVLVLLRAANENPAAKEFYDFLQSEDAETVFEEFGFARLAVAAAN